MTNSRQETSYIEKLESRSQILRKNNEKQIKLSPCKIHFDWIP